MTKQGFISRQDSNILAPCFLFCFFISSRKKLFENKNVFNSLTVIYFSDKFILHNKNTILLRITYQSILYVYFYFFSFILNISSSSGAIFRWGFTYFRGFIRIMFSCMVTQSSCHKHSMSFTLETSNKKQVRVKSRLQKPLFPVQNVADRTVFSARGWRKLLDFLAYLI